MVHECTEMLLRTSWRTRICIAQLTLTKQFDCETMAVRTSEQARHRAPLVLECAIYATPMRIRSGEGDPSPARRTGHMGNYGRRNPRVERETQGYDTIVGPCIQLLRAKISRAHGGCLGAGSRRRARQAAIRPGEAQTAFDPGVPEWGNPAGVMPCYQRLNP